MILAYFSAGDPNSVQCLTAHGMAEQLRRYFNSLSSTKEDAHPQAYLLHNGPLQSLAHLEQHTDVGDDGPVLRFTDPSTAEQIWDALLQSGHTLIVAIQPFLEALTKE